MTDLSQFSTTITLDLMLFARCFVAFLWGISWALFLQFNRWGQFLVDRRTWITVVIGVGVDLGIAFPGDWWTATLVIACSSVGIIVRSLINERREENSRPKSYKVMRGLEDSISLATDIETKLTELFEAGNLEQAEAAQIGKVLALASRLARKVRNARQGKYE